MTISPASQWSAEFTRHVLVTVRLDGTSTEVVLKKYQVPGTVPSGKPPKSEPYRTVPCRTMQWKSANRLHCQKGPAEVVLSSPAEEVQPATGLTETVLLRHHWIHPLHFYNCLVQLKSDLRRLRRVVRTAERIIGTTLPTFQEMYLSRASKRTGKITLDPHIQHTPSLNCYRLADATELWAPERPDTGTVSSPRQYTSWTLNNKRGTLVLGGIPVHTEYRCLFFLRYEFFKYRNTGVI